jgi:hypothetical protein
MTDTSIAEDDDVPPLAAGVKVYCCNNCGGGHIVFIDEDEEPLCEIVVDLEDLEGLQGDLATLHTMLVSKGKPINETSH